MSETQSIWVFIEHTDGVIADVSLELTGKARELGDQLGFEVVGLLCGHEVDSLAQEVIAHGADRVLLADHELAASTLAALMELVQEPTRLLARLTPWLSTPKLSSLAVTCRI